MFKRNKSALMATAMLILGAAPLLTACGDEHHSKLFGQPKTLSELKETSRVGAEHLLFIYDDTAEGVSQDKLVDAAMCAATRTKLFAESKLVKAGETYGNLTRTAEYERFADNMTVYRNIPCAEDNHSIECDGVRQKLVADLGKMMSTEEFSVLSKQDLYNSVAHGYNEAVAGRCIAPKNI